MLLIATEIGDDGNGEDDDDDDGVSEDDEDGCFVEGGGVEEARYSRESKS